MKFPWYFASMVCITTDSKGIPTLFCRPHTIVFGFSVFFSSVFIFLFVFLYISLNVGHKCHHHHPFFYSSEYFHLFFPQRAFVCVHYAHIHFFYVSRCPEVCVCVQINFFFQIYRFDGAILFAVFVASVITFSPFLVSFFSSSYRFTSCEINPLNGI